MFFREVLNEDLGCASSLVANGNEAVVIDPKWEVEEYLRIAEENGFTITHILETHNHADHLSGKGRLAKATGATIHISKDTGVQYEHEPLEVGEWAAGHVEDSIHAPYRTLRDGVPEEVKSTDKPIAVACSGGIRSALAASLLKRAGIKNVEHVADGGVPMLSKEGIELVQGA